MAYLLAPGSYIFMVPTEADFIILASSLEGGDKPAGLRPLLHTVKANLKAVLLPTWWPLAFSWSECSVLYLKKTKQKNKQN